jgi:hypothetical protein
MESLYSFSSSPCNRFRGQLKLLQNSAAVGTVKEILAFRTLTLLVFVAYRGRGASKITAATIFINTVSTYFRHRNTRRRGLAIVKQLAGTIAIIIAHLAGLALIVSSQVRTVAFFFTPLLYVVTARLTRRA